jgi:restriction endonuclease
LWLSKIRKLLARQGVLIAYPTLYRFAVEELQFGRAAATIPILDGEPGEELQVDTAWVGWLTLPLLPGKRRRFRAWIFTAVRSRYRFVYPTFEETTTRAIEACEAAWEFFKGIFKVLIPDNTKAIIVEPDALTPRLTPAFLEYAQARGFQVDPARVRHARDKARVERAVATVRDDCFAGERLATLEDARVHAGHWCREKDDLGVTPPTIIVQVKSGEGDVNEAAVSELSGKVSEKDFGLFVSAGGFNKRALDFAFSKRNLKLINGNALVELVYKYYPKLDGKYKGMIPLRSVYIPETLTE